MNNNNVGMSKVILGLYIGNYRDSKDIEQLTENGITHIIAIHDTARRLFPNKEYLLITAADEPSTNLTQYFQECNDFIHHARLTGGKVLIHCLAGISRSVTVGVAYIMSVTSLGCQEAIGAIRGARPLANPNDGFQRQLHDFETSKLSWERRRLSDKFGQVARAMASDDESQCLQLVVQNRQNWDTCTGYCSPPSRCPTGVCRGKSRLFRRRVSTSKVPTKVAGDHRKETPKKVRRGSSVDYASPKRKAKDNSKTHLIPSTAVAMYSIEMKRSWSDPCHVRLTSPLRRAVSLPYLSTPLLNADCIALSVSNDHLVAQFDLPHPLALPEITHAYESEDGVDPLHASLCQDTKCTRRGSLVRYCVEHISSFSNSSIARLNRSLRALWPSSK